LYSWPLAAALLMSMLLVMREHWPHNPLQRLLAKRRLLPIATPQWRERLQRLRLRRHK
jgi:Ca-activated chloride channel family protein